MRQIINISLPASMAEFVEKSVKEGGYASKSEFFRTILRFWQSEEARDQKDIALLRKRSNEKSDDFKAFIMNMYDEDCNQKKRAKRT